MNPVCNHKGLDLIRDSHLDEPQVLKDALAAAVVPNRKRLLLTCMPKSGSSFLTLVLEHLLKFPKVHLTFDSGGRREQELHWYKLVQVLDRDAFFLHQHVRASSSTVEALNMFQIQTVVQVRNIFDLVVSFRDHLLRESLQTPLAYVEPSFYDLSETRQLDFIIDLAVPWYVNFYLSWYHVERDHGQSVCWVTYETLMETPETVVTELGRFAGITPTPTQVSEALAFALHQPMRARLNKGLRGRGNAMLSRDQKARICRLATYYPDVDFHRIGIEHSIEGTEQAIEGEDPWTSSS